MKLPDLPRFVETNDLLAYEGSVVRGTDTDFVVFSEEDDIGSIVGRPNDEHLARAAVVSELLCFDDNIDALRDLEVFSAFHKQPATIFEARTPLGDPEHPVRDLKFDDLKHVGDLKEELEDALEDSGHPVVCALDGETPVAFAYVASKSGLYWDISIDTLEGHRRRGFAMSAVRGLASHMEGIPVWGAAQDNLASFHLAKKLGFVEVDSLWVMSR